MDLVPDSESLTELLRGLVTVPSVNPGNDPTGEGEGALGAWLAAYGRAEGFAVGTQEVLPGRPNVLLDLGLEGLPTLALVTHLDTVSRQGLTPRAAAVTLEDGRLYGRGACDAKASLAAMLHALQLLRPHRERLRVNVQVAAMMDEEHTFQGVLGYVRALSPDRLPVAAIVGEPTRLQVVIAHKGVLRFRLVTHGRAAHTSQPELGRNAIEMMADLLVALRARFAAEASPPHPLLGLGALTVSQIAGGVAVNVVPEICTITIDRRLLPGESPDAVLVWIDHLLADLRAAEPTFAAEREAPFLVDAALETPPDAPIVAAVLGARNALLGPSAPVGAPYGTDGSKLARGGVPTLVLGPGDIAQAHTADEWVELAQVAQAAQIYAASALAMG